MIHYHIKKAGRYIIIDPDSKVSELSDDGKKSLDTATSREPKLDFVRDHFPLAIGHGKPPSEAFIRRVEERKKGGEEVASSVDFIALGFIDLGALESEF